MAAISVDTEGNDAGAVGITFSAAKLRSLTPAQLLYYAHDKPGAPGVLTTGSLDRFREHGCEVIR